jgi:hypothetical protein
MAVPRMIDIAAAATGGFAAIHFVLTRLIANHHF